MLEKYTKILLFCLIFLFDFRIFNLPIPTIILLISLIFILVFHKSKIIKRLFIKDNVKNILFILLFITIATYLFNIGNIESIKRLYYSKTGERPNYLYLKIAFNGIFFLLTALLAFCIGKSYNGDEKAITRIIKFIVNLATINALINIIAWAIQTGGVISRYNYIPPVITSYGVNIQYSILGFILCLPNTKKFWNFNFQTIKLLILFISILIIISRQNQIMFLILVAWYFLYTTKNDSKLLVKIFSIVFIAGTIYIIRSNLNKDFVNIYLNLFNSQGDDFIVRYNILMSGLNMFIENIFFGVGFGMFGAYNTTAVAVTGVYSFLDSPHNGIISILAEMGLVGLIINYILAVNILKRLSNIKKKTFQIVMDSTNYIFAIFIFIVSNIYASFISNYILFPPPSEYVYYGFAFVSWLLIGFVISFENSNNHILQ